MGGVDKRKQRSKSVEEAERWWASLTDEEKKSIPREISLRRDRSEQQAIEAFARETADEATLRSLDASAQRAAELRRESDRQRKRAQRIPRGTIETDDGSLALPGEPTLADVLSAPGTEPVKLTGSDQLMLSDLQFFLRENILGGCSACENIAPDPDMPEEMARHLLPGSSNHLPTAKDVTRLRAAHRAAFGAPPNVQWQRCLKDAVLESLRYRQAPRAKRPDVPIRTAAEVLEVVRATALPWQLPRGLTAERLETVLRSSTLTRGGGGLRNYNKVIDDLLRELGFEPYPFE